MQTNFFPLERQSNDAIPDELNEGLLAEQSVVSSKYLYDALGSTLFEAICELPEYYPTRTEAAIFRKHLSGIAQSVGSDCTLIDLGAGNCEKAARLFSALQPAQYVPIDISTDFLRDAVACLQYRFPHIPMMGFGMDFSAGVKLPPEISRERRLFFYPGSSIGNFTPEQAQDFLARIREACGADGGLLIGVDLVKDRKVLEAAYDDALGVTAAFNLNVLRNLNRQLNANFDPHDWQHRAFFNETYSRIEMHLEARHDANVKWQHGRRRFRKGERIHTENSYKYTPQAFIQLLARAGFGDARVWTDERNWFMVCHARAMQ